jgi:hypothetical protein
MSYVRIPGIRPINAYAWAAAPRRVKVRMAFCHARFIPRWMQRIVTAWFINRTPGPRWSYR